MSGWVQMGVAFLQPGPWVCSCSAWQTKTKTAKMEGYLSILMFHKSLLIGKPSFQNGVMYKKTAHCQQVSKAHPSSVEHCLTASNMNLLHFTVQSEALLIIIQKIYCTDAQKLVILSFEQAGS